MGTIRKNRNFHQARWDEPFIMDMGNPGERGIIISEVEEGAQSDVASLIPAGFARKTPPKLPELGQMQVLRHYLRLSQETIGADLNIDIGLGTCTMKYSPKINEQFVRSSKVNALHPYQDESTVQGMLEIIYNTTEYLKEISGLDDFSLQPAGGSQAIYANVAVIRAYHEERGEGEQRNEIITTMLSHPGNPGAAATHGYKVITLMPGKDGHPDLDALKAVLSERTAALLITNPEDTGIFNPQIREFTDAVHAVGGLCCYDQANLNGLFCLTRAKEAGFDMCHYNLHKSFSSPHGCQGPGAGAQGVVKKLAKYLPSPMVRYDGQKYYLEEGGPASLGKLRKFYGVPAVVVRAYAFIRSLGQEGLKQVAELSILNNNYMLEKLLKIKGLTMPYADGVRRLEQARLSWQEMTDETGVTTDDICRRIVDYGFQDYFTSHHPRVIPEPFTPEPVESYSRDDIDEYVAAFESIARECRENPELVKTAPHKAALATQIDEDGINNIKRFATTLRAFRKYVEKEA
ncbi:aminomethyl-transferring glycine dehydrogenase subunit GcvPB [Desulfovibrio sp. OttesenSCG-928-I05]|nr:aminomethyl-transferring glycine dehydrogenase subunit GcvPB [Desulfovibrio sp. OttesenSCG-928-I05]